MPASVTIAQVMAWEPCDAYSEERVAELFAGRPSLTAPAILALDIPAQDRLWATLRNELLDDRTLRLFAVWCARQALTLIANPDPRSVAACDIAERYANGRATAGELDTARDAAWDAAGDAARDAAWDAAGDAARDAASAAAWAAARDAASAAAWAAAWYATRDAGDAAWATWDAAWDAQVDHLRAMLTT